MAVKIRMKKMGRTHRPFFRICAVDSRAPRDGRVIEQLGTYDPMVPEKDARAILKGERIAYWLGVGAQASPKVGTLIKKYGKEGTHLDAQTEAIERLGGRRAKSIEEARAAAAAVKIPDVTKPSEDPAPAAAEGDAAKPAEGEAKADAAADAPAEEKKAEDKPGEEAKTEAPAEEKKAEEKPAAEEEKAEEKPAEEAKAEEKPADAPAEEKKAE